MYAYMYALSTHSQAGRLDAAKCLPSSRLSEDIVHLEV